MTWNLFTFFEIIVPVVILLLAENVAVEGAVGTGRVPGRAGNVCEPARLFSSNGISTEKNTSADSTISFLPSLCLC